MPDFNFLVLYVDDPARSAASYADLLAAPIVEQSPTFAMLPLRDGVMLGLWSRHGVEPKCAGQPGAVRSLSRWPMRPPSRRRTRTGHGAA
jgi:hypothetical protein